MTSRRASTAAHAHALRALHTPGDPLILYNVWDAISASVVASNGARALATSSAAVAVAHGYGDGEALPLWLAFQNAERIRARHDLPLSVDIESGYGPTPRDVADTVMLMIGAGACGINLEDQMIGANKLRGPEAQAERIAAAREAGEGAGVELFINARTDVFLKDADPDDGVKDAIQRAQIYKAAGADGLFVPGLTALPLIDRLCREAGLPVNIMMAPQVPPIAELARVGVARVSFGFSPMQGFIGHLGTAAASALQPTS